jgi:hypothetical protein
MTKNNNNTGPTLWVTIDVPKHKHYILTSNIFIFIKFYEFAQKNLY